MKWYDVRDLLHIIGNAGVEGPVHRWIKTGHELWTVEAGWKAHEDLLSLYIFKIFYNQMALFKEKEKSKRRVENFHSMIREELNGAVQGCEAWNYHSHLPPGEKQPEKETHTWRGAQPGKHRELEPDPRGNQIQRPSTSELCELKEPVNPLYCWPIWVGFSVTISEDILIQPPIHFHLL